MGGLFCLYGGPFWDCPPYQHFCWCLEVGLNFLTKKIVAVPKMQCHQFFWDMEVTEALLGKIHAAKLKEELPDWKMIFSSFFRYGKNYLMSSLAMSVRPSVCPSVRTIIVLLGGQLLVGPSLKWLATLKWLTT